MESRQGKSTSFDLHPGDRLDRLYRDVLTDAIKDIGSTYGHIDRPVISWMGREQFENCCLLARIDSGWARELMNSVHSVPKGARRRIASQCAAMLAFAGEAVASDPVGEISNRSLPFPRHLLDRLRSDFSILSAEAINEQVKAANRGHSRAAKHAFGRKSSSNRVKK